MKCSKNKRSFIEMKQFWQSVFLFLWIKNTFNYQSDFDKSFSNALLIKSCLYAE